MLRVISVTRAMLSTPLSSCMLGVPAGGVAVGRAFGEVNITVGCDAMPAAGVGTVRVFTARVFGAPAAAEEEPAAYFGMKPALMYRPRSFSFFSSSRGKSLLTRSRRSIAFDRMLYWRNISA